jgi:hypothetical protein
LWRGDWDWHLGLLPVGLVFTDKVVQNVTISADVVGLVHDERHFRAKTLHLLSKRHKDPEEQEVDDR